MLVRVPPSAGGAEGVTSSALCVGGVDESFAVGVGVVEGVLVGVGVSVGVWEGEGLSVDGAAGGCVLGSEVVCLPEHAANVKAIREERVRAVRRLTGWGLYFIRISYV